MTQFSSGRQDHLTEDQFPWREMMTTNTRYRSKKEAPSSVALVWDPRHSFSVPLTNPFSLLLADARHYRNERVAKMNNPKDWEHVRRVMNQAIVSGFYSPEDINDEQVTHAREVLMRLSRLEAA